MTWKHLQILRTIPFLSVVGRRQSVVGKETLFGRHSLGALRVLRESQIIRVHPCTSAVSETVTGGFGIGGSQITRAVLLTLVTCLFIASAQAKYSGGTGEPNDPYQIATVADLI